MCVIFLVNKVRPTEQMITKAWDRNDDGGGVAWREPAEDGHGTEVVWKKGLNLEEMKHYCAVLPAPFVAHFRVASSGGVRPSLTHPFPVSSTLLNTVDGRTKGYVLFHNGDWKSWDEAARTASIMTKTPIPPGRWSDSRAIAWLCSIYGLGFMEFLPSQKGIAFGPNDLNIFYGPGWVPVNDVWCSNDYFLSKPSYFSPFCKFGTCNRKDVDKDGFCPDHKLKPIVIASEVGSNTGTGGSQGQTTPFPHTPGQVISMELAERLHKEKKISKQLLKSIRKAHANLKMPGKKGAKAERALQLASRSLTFVGQVN